MAGALYSATALITLLCAALLLRAYGMVRRRLLLWSGLCFLFLTLSYFLKVIDLVFLPQIDLYTYRLSADAVAMALLLYGLIWESQ